jgi:hypothetical protein
MSHGAFLMWSIFCTYVVIFVVYTLGAPLAWWWMIPVGGLIGFTFATIKRRAGR